MLVRPKQLVALVREPAQAWQAVAPGEAEKEPAGQDRHCDRLCSPTEALYVPAGQGTQDFVVTLAAKPAGQLDVLYEQEEEPAGDRAPSSQGRHAEDETAPTVVEYVPAAQRAQLVPFVP
jgi:hypothetical protein